MRDLRQSIRRTWRHKDNVCPPAQFDVQNRIADFITLLQLSEYTFSRVAWNLTYDPFIFVRPDPRSNVAYLFRFEECEGSLCCDYLDFHILVL